MSDSLGTVSFHPQFAKNRIDTSFRPTLDGEVDSHPLSAREPGRTAYDPRLDKPNEGAVSAQRF